MAQYLPLPDGNSVTIREGETPQQAYARAQRMYPDSFPKAQAPGEGPESGFTPALKAGYSGLKSGLAALAGKTGIMDEEAAAKYMQEQEEYQKKTFKPTATFGEAPLTKTAELLGGSLPYMAAPLIAGGAAASAPVSGALGLGALGASVLGGTAAGAASAAQFTGSNLQRQLDENKNLTLGQADLGAAALAAIPQAALDVISLKMLPGIRNILSAGGKEVSSAAAKKFAEQGLKEVAKDYAAATGKAMSAGALTEAGQQVLERAQAGLDITDEKARAEYWDSMVGGAVLGGVLSPAGRYVERRGEARAAEGEKFKEAQAARIEEEKRLADEADARSKPEYARKVVADYEAFEKQKTDLKAQIRKIQEGSPTELADKEFNKALNKQLNKLVKDAEPLANEYNRVLPIVAKEKEAARLAGMTPEEYMLETMPVPEAATRTREQRGASLNAGPEAAAARLAEAGVEQFEPVVPSEAPGPETKYAADRVTLAREQQPAADAKDYVDYLMEDPAMARAVAKNRTPLPGLTADEQGAVHGALRLKFKAEDTAAAKIEATATKEEMTQRTEDLKAQKTTEDRDPLAALKASMAGDEEVRTTGEANFDYLDPIFEKALEGQQPVVAVNPAIKPSRDAKRIKTNIDTLTKAIDTAEQDYITAKRAGESSAASAAFGRGNQAIEQLQQFEQDEAGGAYAQSVLKSRNDQQAALNSVEESLDRLRKGEVLSEDKMASSTQAGLVTRSEKARADFIKAVLQEAATHRRANGQPAMTTDEAVKAASELYDTFNEWIKRVQNEPKRDTSEAVMVEPAQMRANKLVREARYEQRKVFDSRPIEGYRFGAYPQAVQVMKDQLDQIRDRLGQVDVQVEKIEPLLKTQFATTEAEKTAEARGDNTKTLSGELRRRSDYVGNMLEKAFTRNIPEELREVLEQAQDVIVRGKASRNLLDAVEVQAGRILRGEDTGSKIVPSRKVMDEGRPVYEVTPDGTMRQGIRGRRTADVGKTVAQAPASEYMQDIKDALAAYRQLEQGSETVGKVEGQKELFAPSKQFGTIRATPESFNRSPMVLKARAAIARAADALKQANRYSDVMKQRSEAIALFTKQIDDAQSGMEGAKWLSMAYPKVGTSLGKFEPRVPTAAEVKADPKVKAKYDAAKAVADRYNKWVDTTNEQNSLLLSEGVNAPANVKAKAIAKQLVEMKKGLLSAIDTYAARVAPKPTATARTKEKLAVRIDAAKDLEAEQRGKLQKAVDFAVKDKRMAMEAAQEALKPKIAELQKSLAETEATLQKRYDAADAEGISPDNKARIDALLKEVTDSRTKIDAMQNEAQATFDTTSLVAAAHTDNKVKFEFRVLARLQKNVADLVARRKEVAPPDIAAAARAAEEQRKVADRADALAREEAIKADKEKRELEQRLATIQSAGIKGVERIVGGQRVQVLTAQQAKESKALDDAAKNAREAAAVSVRAESAQAQAAFETEKKKQGKRAIGPVTREETAAPAQFRAGTEESKAGEGRTSTKQTLSETRGVKTRNVPITPGEMIEASEVSAKDPLANLRTRVLTARQEALSAAQAAASARTTESPALLIKANAAEARLENALQALNDAVDATKTPAQRKREAKARGVYRTSTQGGATLETEAVERLVKRVTENWKNAPEIVIVASETGLPARIQEQIKTDEKTGMIPGLYDPDTKIVYLITDNLHSGNDVILTIAHEATGHFGLREMFGSALDVTMDKLYEGNPAVRKQVDAKMKDEPNLTKQVAVEEVLAEMAETGGTTPAEKSALRRIYDVIKAALRKFFGLTVVLDSEVQQIVANARNFVIEGGVAAKGAAENVDTTGVLYSTKPRYANPEMERLGRTTDKFVAKNKTTFEKIRAAATGLSFETMLVDRFAGFERLAKYMDQLKGSQMLMYLRQYDQRMHMVQQSIENGAPIRKEITRADGRKEYIIESKEGANIKNVIRILKDAQPYVGNGEAVNRTFTMYLAALRAENKGLAALNFGEDVTEAMLADVMKAVDGNAALKKVFDQARDEYNAYNRDMIQFLASSGAISKSTATMLSASNDYIPFYREQNGVAQLLIGGEAPIKLGNIADQPHLKELVGGDKPILDFMVSSVQNTNMLVDMAMRNLATKNAVFELVGLNAAKIVGKTAGPDVVRYKDDGEDRYAVIATETIKIGNKEFSTGVPADLLVKGMEGIPTQMPVLLRAMAVPAQLLRKAITLSPLYMAKQLFRDSLAAPILSGANFTPVFGALRELNSATKGTLEQRGIVGSQYMTGSSEDISQILRTINDGKPGWMKALGALEATGMELDAVTRRAQYNSYISQGLSEMEATLLALESMNFNKRGASPSIHAANALIPFFNAQIQGLNVMYKAMTGNLPFNDRLNIQAKLLQRGALMAGATFLYAAAMEDDEAYKNATPDQKYGSWFVRIPGVSEPVRIPLPFEIGYIFKALPEALYNTMTSKNGGEEAVKAFKQILLNTIPGGSSYGIPQVMKPAIEAGLGKSFYTGRDILSAREKELLPEEQFRANTADISKALGKTMGISPIIFEQLVSGYTGTMGLAFLHAVSLGVPKSESPENAVKRLSEYPIVGSAFQPNDAGGIINSVYERFNEDIKVRNSVKRMMVEGRTAEAKDLLQRRGNEYLEAEMADKFKANMDKLTAASRAVQASTMSAEEKRKQLDAIKKIQIGLSTFYREASDKTRLLPNRF
jgi:hypothetical protein